MKQFLEDIIVLLAVAVAVVGYSLIYNVPKRTLVPAIFNALAGWAIYDLVSEVAGATVGAFAAAVAVAFLGEIFAREVKTPASIFIVIGTLPLVPGSNFYYTIEAGINNKLSLALTRGFETTGIALAIAMGILVNSTFFQIIHIVKVKIKRRRLKNAKGAISESEVLIKQDDEIADEEIEDE